MKRVASGRRALQVACAFAALLAACRGSGPSRVGPARLAPLSPLSLAADTARADTVAPGVVHHFFYLARGPWAVHVLDVDRAECWTAIASKGGPGARGRRTTSRIADWESNGSGVVAGAVNADFFVLADGTPQGAYISDYTVVAGPAGARPAFGITVNERPWIGTPVLRGTIVAGSDSFAVTAWNRPDSTGIAVLDPQWGPRSDSATGAVEVLIGPFPRDRNAEPGPSRFGAVYGVDTLPAGAAIPVLGRTIVVGARADARARALFRSLRAGLDSVHMTLGLDPEHPAEAVGGRPILLLAGHERDGLEQFGGAGFGPVRHPRTAVGYDSAGRRLLLVTVDGRQPPYSAGMTLRELAGLMRDLGAYEALNLDGGGSTTMVLRAPGADAYRPSFRVANRPSDKEGERTVGNALVIVRAEPELGVRAWRDFRDDTNTHGWSCFGR